MITLKQLKFQLRKPEESVFDLFRRKDGELDYDRIIKNVLVPDWFLEKYKEKLNWDLVSQYQNLSEESVMRFFHYINWELVKKYQFLSDRFISSYEHNKNKLVAYE